MERLADKAVVVLCCLAAYLFAPADAAGIAGMLAAIIVASVRELSDGWSGRALTLAYCAAACFVPALVPLLPLAAYDCMREGEWPLRAAWAVPLAATLATTEPATLVPTLLTCALAALLSIRTSKLIGEREGSRELRDGLRERNIALQVDVEALRAEGAEADGQDMHDFFVACGLTEREAAIAELVAQGKDNREIARSVYASEGTVRNNVSSILKKLGVSNRTQVALVYYRR